MKILLEGPDCSGKTTLARTLKNCFDLTYIHHSFNPDDIKYAKEYSEFSEYVKNTNDILVDRWTPSEVVYGNIIRGKSRINEEELLYSISLFDYVIFCLPHPPEKYLENFIKTSSTREEYVRDKKLMMDIYNNYNSLFLNLSNKQNNNNKPKLIKYNFYAS